MVHIIIYIYIVDEKYLYKIHHLKNKKIAITSAGNLNKEIL